MTTGSDPRSLREELGRRRLEALGTVAEHSAYAFALVHMRTERRQFLSFRERPYLVDILAGRPPQARVRGLRPVGQDPDLQVEGVVAAALSG